MDTGTALPTEFAPAERVSAEEVRRQARHFGAHPLLCELLDAMPTMVLVLNAQRQIVHANEVVLGTLGHEDRAGLLGLRPGELLGCLFIHEHELEQGCGTTLFCSRCGAVKAILAAQRGMATVRECLILRRVGDSVAALDLRVVATRFVVGGEAFVIFAVDDISAEKRRRALEQVFFHDVLNSAGALHNCIELLGEARGEGALDFTATALRLSEQLLAEIQAQRNLAVAEAGELAVESIELNALGLVEQIQGAYASHQVAAGKQILIAPGCEDACLRSDPTLLGRVLGNLVKNALEASQPGQAVTLGCRREGNGVEFWVHNAAWMPLDVQLQLFKRSFSTRGAGRGLGTYSARLLGERYLRGRLWFNSTEQGGTVFHFWCPEVPDP